MPEDRSHDVETDAERERLRSLIARLSDKDLSGPDAAGGPSRSARAHRILGCASDLLMDKWARGVRPYAPTSREHRSRQRIGENLSASRFHA